MKKRVVYLFGAGATQAELEFQSEPERLLTSDILRRIVLQVSSGICHLPDNIKMELSDGSDLEELISLCDSSGSIEDKRAAEELRKAFQEDVGAVVGRLGPDFQPMLTQALLEMHKIAELDETLSAILTTNYDDFIERAAQRVLRSFAYGVRVSNHSRRLAPTEASDLNIIKLHGSFNWEAKHPVSVVDYTTDALWVPPGSQKSTVNYPFSLLWGKARETLDCDVLRIVGSSLTRHDWHLMSLVFMTQKLRSDRRKYDIEVICPLTSYGQMIRSCQYLDLKHASETQAMTTLMENDKFPDRAAMVPAADAPPAVVERYDEDYPNSYEAWLRGVGQLLDSQGVLIEESKYPSLYAVAFG